MTDKPLKIVEWEDAVCISSWTSPLQALPPIKAVSCGFVLHEDDSYIQLAGTVSEDGEYNQCMTIPRGMVVSVRDA